MNLRAVCLLTALSTSLFGTTMYDVLSVAGPSITGAGIGEGGANGKNSPGDVEFTITTALSDVVFSAQLNDGVAQTVTVWLASQTGPSASPPAVATNSLTLTAGVTQNYTVLTVPQLNPGTYWLIIGAVNQLNEAGWSLTPIKSTETNVASPGASLVATSDGVGTAAFEPSYNFGATISDSQGASNLIFEIDAATPEPSAVLLLAAGLVGLSASKLFRSR
jgi:PEP-CTERM motif